MAKKGKRLNKSIVLAYMKLCGADASLCRQASATEEAMKNGDGFIYFSSQGWKIGPKTARFLIEKEIVKPVSDGLFEGSSQSFIPAPRDEFQRFKEQYEAM